tara:strand:- start:362 stop:1117 length:756 start_codon:yes stop_codon:yes gene_type:complete
MALSGGALGCSKIGGEGIAGQPQYAAPTVSVAAIGTVTANPHTVSWTYSQKQQGQRAGAAPQEFYRIEYISDDGSITYSDTGWVSGADTSYATDLTLLKNSATGAALVTNGNTDLSVRVSVRGPVAIGTGDADRYTSAPDTEDFTALNLGVPTLTPGNVVFGSTSMGTNATYTMTSLSAVTLNWTYAHGGSGEAQHSYRVKLLEYESGVELFDSGWVTSAATTYTLNYAFLDDFKYTVSMQARNTNYVETT